MGASYSYTESTTFTVTHARHMATKVTADLKRMQRFYGAPSDERIAAFEAEVIELLRLGYLGTVTYGFRRGEQFVEPAVRYTARDLAGTSAADDDPGRIRPGANTAGATFYSYLTYSAAWDALSSGEQAAVKARLPVQRTGTAAPGVSGYYADDKTYSSGGRALARASVRSY